MSETKQTRCPFCNSVFNITDAQLAARGGHVRCGSCLQVFRADQNLVSGLPVTPTGTPPSAPAPAQAPQPASMPDAGGTGSTPVVSRTQSSAPAAGDQPIGQRKKKKLEDESWAFNLISDEGEVIDPEASPAHPQPKPPATPEPPPAPAPKAKKPMFDDELSDMLHEAWQEEPSKSGHQLKGPGEVEKIKAAADDSWAQALLSEIAEEEKKEQSKNYSMEVLPPSKTGGKETARKTPPASPKAAEPARQKHADTSRDKPAGNSDDDLLNFLNSNSAPTLSQSTATLPVEVRHQRHLSVNWGYYLTWSFLCMLALAALTAQYVYFNFEKLSVSASTRPRMIELCDTLKCKVPEPPDIGLLAIQKLVVRKHPEVSHALIVNTILFNKAVFTQPLPNLKLVLTNKKGEVVAGRMFTPGEYLSMDYSNLRRIPPQTPIHIELALANPNVPFTGYKMQPVF